MKRIAQERKTTLTPMQLISELRRDAHQEFSPELLNEIGIIFLEAKDITDRTLAEEVLIRALAVENPKSQFVAYCQLRRANGNASNEVQIAVTAFQENAVNKKIIETAEREYWL